MHQADKADAYSYNGNDTGAIHAIKIGPKLGFGM
jgi:hypothetical protein